MLALPSSFTVLGIGIVIDAGICLTNYILIPKNKFLDILTCIYYESLPSSPLRPFDLLLKTLNWGSCPAMEWVWSSAQLRCAVGSRIPIFMGDLDPSLDPFSASCLSLRRFLIILVILTQNFTAVSMILIPYHTHSSALAPMLGGEVWQAIL